MARKPKHDYDSEAFLTMLYNLALGGLSNAEVASRLTANTGQKDENGNIIFEPAPLSPEAFSRMINGNFDLWTEEENERRSSRFRQVLARARTDTLGAVRNTYLQVALGKRTVKSTTTTKRHLVVDGEATNDVEVMTTETVSGVAPSLQALSTWLHHHDPEWRKIERNQDDEAYDIPVNVKEGLDVGKWIRSEIKTQSDSEYAEVPAGTDATNPNPTTIDLDVNINSEKE